MTHTDATALALSKTLVVVPSFNGRHLLERFLPTVDIPPEQVLVVDQGNADGTEELCARRGVRCLQLGRQASFTVACNAGITWALDHGARYICLANNDVEFLTPVIHQLLETTLTETKVGAAAPTQIDRRNRSESLSYRVRWDLSLPHVYHDMKAPPGRPAVLESDYCSFTCVFIPAQIFREVGLLDDEYVFCYEDVDFGYRLFKSGFRTVYDQRAQIVHHQSSTLSPLGHERKLSSSRRDRRRFAAKHLRHGVRLPTMLDFVPSSWGVISQELNHHLKLFGLEDARQPMVQISHPGAVASPYLFTVWETTELPAGWRDIVRQYKQVFVTSQWNQEIFSQAGCRQVWRVPLGVDPDIYQPSGPEFKLGPQKTFLSVCLNQHRKALDVTIQAWLSVQDKMPDAQLVLFARNLAPESLLRKPDRWRWYGKLKVYEFVPERISILLAVEGLDYHEMAALYRGAHALVLNSRSEGFGLPIIEAMACGTLAIVPNYGATAEFIRDGNCLPLRGTSSRADYADQGFGDVGSWWEPSVDDLQERLLEAYCFDDHAYRNVTSRARQLVLSEYTWRRSAGALLQTLTEIQKPLPRQVVDCADLREGHLGQYVGRRFMQLGRKFIVLGQQVEEQGVLTASYRTMRYLMRLAKRLVPAARTKPAA